MINPEITQLNRDEIYRYLGLQSGSPLLHKETGNDLRLDEQISRCEQTVLETARIRCVYRILPLSAIILDVGNSPAAGNVSDSRHDKNIPDDCAVINDSDQSASIALHGKDIARLLDGCSEAVFMALTLGAELERVLMKQEVTDMSDALVLDICASAAVETAADDFERKLSAELKSEDKYLTNRFSPGYGDFALSHQRPVLELLNASRAAGITLTPSQLMVPRKSVTAVMGICTDVREKVLGGCGMCPLKSRCSYRSHNLRCYE